LSVIKLVSKSPAQLANKARADAEMNILGNDIRVGVSKSGDILSE
jgi:hypothetical protein